MTPTRGRRRARRVLRAVFAFLFLAAALAAIVSVCLLVYDTAFLPQWLRVTIAAMGGVLCLAAVSFYIRYIS